MHGAKLQSIGIQALTVALLALAVMAYLKTVIAGPPPTKVVRPVPCAVSPTQPAIPANPAAEVAHPPEGASSQASEPSSAPANPLPEAASFHGKSGDHRYDHLILRAARDYGIDPAVIKAVIMAESGFDPQAVSYAGAQGLMQLMPRTAKALEVGNALDPQANILGGTRYLKRLLERFEGNLELALAAYNAGSRNVRKHKGVPPFKATRRYIAKIKIYHRYYRQQGFSLPSRVVAAVPPEWHSLGPLAVARYLALFSSMVRTAT